MDESKQPSVRLTELMQLVIACREGVASNEQIEKLRSILETNLDARQAFVELMHLENTLSYHLGGVSRTRSMALGSSAGKNGASKNIAGGSCRILADSLTNIESATPLSASCGPRLIDVHLCGGTWSIHRGVLTGILASCLVLMGWLIGRQSENSSTKVAAVDSGSRAKIELLDRPSSLPLAATIVAYSPGSQWGLMNLAVMPGGTSLRPGQPVELESGAAKIRFANGGVVVLQGPAVFEVQSSDAGYLRSGKATLITSHGGGPVKLTTPSSSAMVQNAELGVVVHESDGSAEMCVLAGKVEVALLNGIGKVIKRELITEGFAGRFLASRLEMSRIEVNEQAFIREMPITYIAYHNLPGFPGEQSNFYGTLGMDFVVKDPVEVTKLGVFDSGADGLRRPITAELWSRNEAGSAYRFDDDYGGDLLAREVFTEKNPGDLVSSNRFKPLDRPLRLIPGAYAIVAHGYGADEPNGNERDNFRVLPEQKNQASYRISLAHKTLDDGRGAILFVGSARFGNRKGAFPDIVDPGSVNRYRAGTFEFRRAKTEKIGGAIQDVSI